MAVLQTLVYIYGFVLLMSSVFTLLLYLAYKEHLLKLLLYFWLSGIFSFILQGALNKDNELAFLAFSSNTISIFLLLKIYHALFDSKISAKTYFLFTIGGMLISLSSFGFGWEYAQSCAPYCIGIFLGIVTNLIQNLKHNTDVLRKGFSVLLFLNALHFIDYPIIRPNPDMAVVGFSIVLGFYFIYSIYIPLFVIKKTSDRYSISLEKEVMARTAELNQANAELLVTNKNLGVITQENQMLLSILVHDISNPIQVLISFVEKTTKIEIETLPQSVKIRTKAALNAILDTLATVRNYHSVRLGKAQPKLSSFKITDIIQSLLEQFEEKVTEKKLQIDVQIPANANTELVSDRAWLKNQIFSNIFSNAIKFSYVEGKINISVEEESNGLAIRFRDFGPGIPDHAKAKLFSSSTATSTLGTLGEKGTGLGMPIVKEYITRLKGTVTIEDTPNNENGACFKVFIPKSFEEPGNQAAS